MAWKTLSEVKMRSRDKNVETFVVQYDGNFYRIQNEFGNISFEFDVSSGYELVEVLESYIMDDINREINSFLNEEDERRDIRDVNGSSNESVNTELRSGDNDDSSKQLNLFSERKTASKAR